MNKSVLVWDDDICWEEQFQRELIRAKIDIEEIDSLRMLQDKAHSSKKYSALIVALEQFMQEISRNDLDETVGKESLYTINGTVNHGHGNWQRYLQELCGQLGIPVYLLAAQEDILQEVAAFESGAADYFWREKDIRTVVARIKSGIYAKEEISVRNGTSVMEDADTYTVSIGNRKIALTELEFMVFRCLHRSKGQVVLREKIFEEIWGKKDTKSMRVVDTVVKQLRRKLEKTQFTILSKYKLGYILTMKS